MLDKNGEGKTQQAVADELGWSRTQIAELCATQKDRQQILGNCRGGNQRRNVAVR